VRITGRKKYYGSLTQGNMSLDGARWTLSIVIVSSLGTKTTSIINELLLVFSPVNTHIRNSQVWKSPSLMFGKGLNVHSPSPPVCHAFLDWDQYAFCSQGLGEDTWGFQVPCHIQFLSVGHRAASLGPQPTMSYLARHASHSNYSDLWNLPLSCLGGSEDFQDWSKKKIGSCGDRTHTSCMGCSLDTCACRVVPSDLRQSGGSCMEWLFRRGEGQGNSWGGREVRGGNLTSWHQCGFAAGQSISVTEGSGGSHGLSVFTAWAYLITHGLQMLAAVGGVQSRWVVNG
jgi:hypothetical protein